jgi:hypothetical protein
MPDERGGCVEAQPAAPIVTASITNVPEGSRSRGRMPVGFVALFKE